MAHYDCDNCGGSGTMRPNCCDWAMMEDQENQRHNAAQKDAERALYDKHKAELKTHAKYYYYLRYYGKKM